MIRQWAPLTVAFKLGDAPLRTSKKMLGKGVTMVLMNSPKTMGSSLGEYTVLSAKGQTTLKGSKEAVAYGFWKMMTELI